MIINVNKIADSGYALNDTIDIDNSQLLEDESSLLDVLLVAGPWDTHEAKRSIAVIIASKQILFINSPPYALNVTPRPPRIPQ